MVTLLRLKITYLSFSFVNHDLVLVDAEENNKFILVHVNFNIYG